MVLDTLGAKGPNQFSQLAQRQPVDSLGNIVDLGMRLFTYRDDDHLDSLAASSIENQKREAAVPRDEAVLTCRLHGWISL